jgi:hypothetical protein
MASSQLDEFGAALMQRVRDKAISQFERTLLGEIKSARARELHSELSRIPEEHVSVVRRAVYGAIDEALARLLQLIDEEDQLEVQWSGSEISEESDGLAGELFSTSGWLNRFSEFPDLH